MNYFCEFISKVPDTIWAAIIASLITLGGVLLSNLDNRKRLKEQLIHDSNQRDREREMAIRREVYFAAAEAVAVSQERLGRIASMEMRELGEKFSSSSLSPAINKIQLIGSEKTVAAVSAFNQKYSESIMVLFPEKIYLQRLQNELSAVINQINGLIASRDEVLNQLKTTQQTEENRKYIENIHIRFQESQSNIEHLFKNRDDKQSLVGRVYFDLLNKCMAHSLSISEQLVDAVIAIREELDLPIDEGFYRRLMDEHQNAARNNYKKYLEDVKESQTK